MKALDLLPDGTFTIRDGSREWATRRPTIAEWRTIFEATEAKDEEARALNALPASNADETRAKIQAQKEFRRSGQWAPVVAQALTLLGPEPVGSDDLPAWVGAAQVIIAVLAHWEEVPLDLSPAIPTTNPPSEMDASDGLSLPA